MENYKTKISKGNPSMLFANGFDEAIIGTTRRHGNLVALYSTDKCIDILAKDMSHEDAEEYFYFNVEGSFMGINTPVFK